MASRIEDSNQDGTPDSRQRLADAWRAHNHGRFWLIVSQELLPSLQRDLCGRFRCSPLSQEDIEDCCQTSLHPFLNGKAEHVADPAQYIRRSAINHCLQELRARRRRREVHSFLQTEFIRSTGMRPGPAGENTEGTEREVRIDRASAMVLFQELVEDVEEDSTWVPGVVQEALGRLRPALRRVATYVMEHDPDTKDEHAAADLGVKIKSYRSNKSRAFNALRNLIREVVTDLDIPLTSRQQQTMFAEHHEFAAEADADLG